jgi:quinolinate synthase
MDEIIKKINSLKKRRSAVILAHNYQRPEVQDVADYCGDSLGLSQEAAKTAADVIVFCGVHFMAETAAIICPGKTVLMPDPNAGCPMANMLTARELRRLKESHPGAAVVTYVNSSAAVKAESNICCTSANAVEIVNSMEKGREILFVPDKSLGDYAAKITGRKILLSDGYCPTHHRIRLRDIMESRGAHPNAKVVVHPECTADVIEQADHVASTSGIIKYCRESGAREFIIGTEIGLLHKLRKDNPGKTFFPATELADCPNMKLTTLEKILWCLEDMQTVVTVPAETAAAAKRAIDRMLAVSAKAGKKPGKP